MPDSPRITRREASKIILGTAGALLAGDALAQSPQASVARRYASLQKKIAGRVIDKTDAAYAKTRGAAVWNKRVAGVRSPDAIVQVASAQDVAAAIRFARANGLKVAIRGGGHNYHGAVLREGGILLDLGLLREIHIDAQQRHASVQPGVKGGIFSTALAPYGLAFPVGHCSDVSLSGYILNGGFGWNNGEWGPACMSVRGMEMVTASGDILYADADHNIELFWAARGAGPGFFTVVTRFDVVLYPMPKAMRVFAANFELESAPIIGPWFTEAIRSVHPAQEAACELGPLDASRKPVITVSTVALAGSQAEASARYASLRTLPAGAKLVGEIVDQPASFQDLLHMIDAYFPNDARMAGDALWTATPVAELLPKLQPLAANAPPAPSSIGLFVLGGNAKAPLGGKSSAFSQAGPMEVGVYGFWDDPARDQTGRAWVRSVMREVEPLSLGGYIGETDLSVSPNRASRCFSPEAWTKLIAMKKKYDPDQLFYSYLNEN